MHIDICHAPLSIANNAVPFSIFWVTGFETAHSLWFVIKNLEVWVDRFNLLQKTQNIAKNYENVTIGALLHVNVHLCKSYQIR